MILNVWKSTNIILKYMKLAENFAIRADKFDRQTELL